MSDKSKDKSKGKGGDAGAELIERDNGDVGVPMKPGGTFAGPEDALGTEPTRGDYSGRVGGEHYHPHEGTEPQRPRAEQGATETPEG